MRRGYCNFSSDLNPVPWRSMLRTKMTVKNTFLHLVCRLLKSRNVQGPHQVSTDVVKQFLLGLLRETFLGGWVPRDLGTPPGLGLLLDKLVHVRVGEGLDFLGNFALFWREASVLDVDGWGVLGH